MKLLYYISYTIVNYLYFLLGVRIHHLYKKFPKKGSLMIVSNHISFLDPPFVGSVIKRKVSFMAKIELFQNHLFGWYFRKVNTFPVKREKGGRRALEKSLKILKDGEGLLVFPEGMRRKQKDGQLNPGKNGVGLIALKTNPTILPVYIAGFEHLLQILLGNIHPVIYIGEPFRLEDLGEIPKGKKGYKIITDEIMNRIEWEEPGRA